MCLYLAQSFKASRVLNKFVLDFSRSPFNISARNFSTFRSTLLQDDRFGWHRPTLAAVPSVPLLAARTSIVRDRRYARRGRRIWRKGTGGGTRVHARTLGGDRRSRTESKDYFGIGGDKPGQHRARVCEREKRRVRQAWARQRRKESETGHKRGEPYLALPRRKHERSLDAWVIASPSRRSWIWHYTSVNVITMGNVSRSLGALDNPSLVHLNHTLATSHVESRLVSGGLFRLRFFLPRNLRAKLESLFLRLFFSHWRK